MALLFDVILLIGVLICIVLCCVRGFARSLIEATGSMIAAFAAYLLAKPAGQWLSRTFAEPFFEEKITERLAEITGQTAEKLDVSVLLADAPESLQKLLQSFCVDIEQVRAVADAQETVSEKSAAVVSKIAASVSSVAATCLCFIVFYLAFSLAVVFAAKIASGLSYIPVIGKINRILGALFGVVKAAVFVCVYTALLHLLLPYLAEPLHLNPDNPYEGSVLCEAAEEYNPIIGLLPTDFVKERS